MEADRDNDECQRCGCMRWAHEFMPSHTCSAFREKSPSRVERLAVGALKRVNRAIFWAVGKLEGWDK